jgi:hypothetical protein
MSDAVQLDLDAQFGIDWDHYDTGSKLTPPPQATDGAGAPITYFGQVAPEVASLPDEQLFSKTLEGNLKVTIPSITLINNGNGVDGITLKFVRMSGKRYTNKKTGLPTNASQLGNYIRSAQLASLKPNSEETFKAAVRASAGRMVAFQLDWSVYDKQAKKEVLKGYGNFAGPMGQKDPFVVTPDNRKLIARAEVARFIVSET